MALTYNEAVEKTITAGEQIHQIVNGTATTEVTVEDGSKVPSVRKALLDNFYFKDPIAWQVGQTENVFNQLRQFTDGSWWYAPSATASNPVSMGSTPVGDVLWKIYDFDAIGKLEPRIDEALRRSYAEAGYNVVGTFKAGFTIVNANDVGIDLDTGKGYTGPAGPVAAGTNPTSGGFVDRSGALWRPKTPDDFTGTDQQKVEAWLAAGGMLEIRRDYTMTSVVAVTVSDASISGHGRIIFPASISTAGSVLNITGDNNKLKELHVVHQGSMLNAGDLITVTGNKNRLDNVESTFLTEYNPTVDGEQYKGVCINLNGDHNSAIECYGDNGGTGVNDNGKNNLVMRNDFNKCCRIVVNTNKSRHSIIDGNTGDCQHKGYPLQGCDGIWGNRSHRFTKYSNNTILNPAEHGAYLQGDWFTWDKTNRVEGAKRCLIKVGAKADGNYAYPGETLPLFNAFGVPDTVNGVYATTGAFIAPRGSGNNTTASSDGCVCLQPNIADLVIDEYEVVDNPDSPFGIRSLYFSSGAGLQVMSNLKVLDGRVLRSGSSSFACADNLEIDGFYSGQKLNITAANAPQGTKNVTIRAECPSIDFTTAPDGIKIIGGKYQYISESSGLNIEIFDAEITRQDLGGSWVAGRVVRLQDSKVKWLGTSIFNINGVNNVVDSTFDLPDANVSYPLQFNFNSAFPLQGHFDGNTIRAPLSERPVRIGGSDATCNSNVIVGSASADYTLTIQGSNVTVVGSVLNAGAVRLDAGSSNCDVNARSVSASGSGHSVTADYCTLLAGTANCNVRARSVTASGDGHSVFADSCTLKSNATNCFAVGKSVSNGNAAGGNVVITS